MKERKLGNCKFRVDARWVALDVVTSVGKMGQFCDLRRFIGLINDIHISRV
jgi:hypothetical protein